MGLNERFRWWSLIAVGGGAGTALRGGLENAWPASPTGWPWTTFTINVVGSFILALVVEVLLLGGPDEGWRKRVRLGVGTGVMGGFTTYSTFVVEIDQRVQHGHAVLAVAYALTSVVLGVAAAVVAMTLARRAVPV